MLEDLKGARKVVGIKQSEKAVASGEATKVYVARDAHERVTAPFVKLCEDAGIEIIYADTMSALGHACGIDVGAAVVAVLD